MKVSRSSFYTSLAITCCYAHASLALTYCHFATRAHSSFRTHKYTCLLHKVIPVAAYLSNTYGCMAEKSVRSRGPAPLPQQNDKLCSSAFKWPLGGPGIGCRFVVRQKSIHPDLPALIRGVITDVL